MRRIISVIYNSFLTQTKKCGAPTKTSAFGLPEVKLLGYVLNADGIKTDTDKGAVMSNILPPTTVKETRSFLGMCNYYRNSLPNYAGECQIYL